MIHCVTDISEDGEMACFTHNTKICSICQIDIPEDETLCLKCKAHQQKGLHA